MLLLLREILDVSLDELQSVRLLRSDIDFCIRGARLSKPDVLLYRTIEEHWLLHDIAALLTQSMHVILIQLFAINKDITLTLLDVVKTQENVSERALAAP